MADETPNRIDSTESAAETDKDISRGIFLFFVALALITIAFFLKQFGFGWGDILLLPASWCLFVGADEGCSSNQELIGFPLLIFSLALMMFDDFLGVRFLHQGTGILIFIVALVLLRSVAGGGFSLGILAAVLLVWAAIYFNLAITNTSQGFLPVHTDHGQDHAYVGGRPATTVEMSRKFLGQGFLWLVIGVASGVGALLAWRKHYVSALGRIKRDRAD